MVRDRNSRMIQLIFVGFTRKQLVQIICKTYNDIYTQEMGQPQLGFHDYLNDLVLHEISKENETWNVGVSNSESFLFG
jgi:hypothetical protein